MHLLLLFFSASCAFAEKFKTHLVVASFKEDLSWIRNTTFSPKDIYVYQRKKPKDPLYVPNKGNECVPYVKHIIDHYFALPDYLLCVHGNPFKRCSKFITYLNAAPIYRSKSDMLDERPGSVVFLTNQFVNASVQAFTKQPHFSQCPNYYEKWLGKPIPDWGTSIWCCAAFQVSRERVLRHSLAFWQNIYEDLMGQNPANHGAIVCAYLEHTWGQIFGEDEVVSPVSEAYVNGVKEPVCDNNLKVPMYL
jgi:hypothetical protein